MKIFNQKLMETNVKTIVLLITYIILGILGILYLEQILSFMGLILDVLSPFIIGVIFAFIFQLPTSFIASKLKIKDDKKRTLISTILSILLVFLVIIVVLVIVLPQIIDNLVTLTNNIPAMLETAEEYADMILANLSLNDEIMNTIESFQKDLGTTIVSSVSKVAPTVMGVLVTIMNSVTNILMGVIIAIYMSLDKERLLRQCNRVGYALFKEESYLWLKDVMNLIVKTFRQFFTGQITESVIIGVLCYLGCKILSIPYASIAAVIIAVTNIIPYFGPFIGTGVAAMLILFVSPIKAVVFVIFGIVLQQFESNLIYPHVVGSSVGLSALWVLFAITIGGGLFGMAGMIFGLPVFSVIYELTRRFVNDRIKLKENKIDEENGS